MEFTKFFNLCCPSNKDSDAGKEFHINNHISFNESKEANYIDNSDFTYFTKKNKIEIEDHLNLAPISKNINNYENENTSEVLLPNINYTSPLDFHKKTLQNIHQSTLNYEIDKKNFILNNLENQAKIKEKSKSIDHTKNVKSIIFDENEKDNSYIINQQANRIDKIDNLNLSMRKKNEEENSNYEIFSSFPVITEEEVNNADIIQIEELDGNLLFNKKLIIMASGLINGARKSSDGVVFFGTKLIKNNIIINDFVINIENDNLTHTFIIYYKRETKKYYLKSYKERESSNVSLVLVKIEDKFIIKKKHILKIGDIYFQFLPGNDKIEIFRLESKTYERKKYEFSSNSVIKIGRNKMCTIAFPDDKSLSRIQCTLKFDNGNWEIIDGYDKLSTNGTWVYIQNSFEINKNEMIVRINNSLIKLSVKENIYSSFFKNLK